MGEHDGHRERLREKYRRSGGEGMTDAQLLELALFYSVPRRDVRERAEDLLARFGSVSGVLDASAAELCEIAGVGENSALLLGLLGALRDAAGRERAGLPLNARDLREYLISHLRGAGQDTLLAVYIGRDGTVAGRKTLPLPDLTGPSRLIDVAARQAVLAGTPNVLMARGFAGAGAMPDREVALAIALRQGLDRVGITLLDYVVVTPTEYLSTVGRLFSSPSFPLSGGRREAKP